MTGNLTTATTTLKDNFFVFKRKLFLIASCFIGTVASIGSLVVLATGHTPEHTLPPYTFIVTIPCVISFILALRRRLNTAAAVFLVGCSVAISLAFLLSTSSRFIISLSGLSILIMLTGFTTRPHYAIVLGIIDLGFVLLINGVHAISEATHVVPGEVVAEVGIIVTTTVVVFVVSRNILTLRDSLQDRLETIERFVPTVTKSGKRIAHDVRQIHTMAAQQRVGVSHQSDAVTEINNDLHTILSSSQTIAESAREVFENAERTTHNNERVAHRIEVLSDQALRISKIVDKINQIANKSELLALNAALEGLRAGTTGAGFSLVAAEMQRLSETIINFAKEIRVVTDEIRETADQTKNSIKEAVTIARKTTANGRKISIVTQQQQSSTEKVTQAMDEIAAVISQIAAGGEQTMRSTQSLQTISDGLPELLSQLSSTRLD